MRAWLLSVGLLSMLGQVVLLREIHVASFGSELILVLALGAWMLTTAFGAFVLRRVEPSRSGLHWVFLALAVAIPSCVVLTRIMRWLLNETPSTTLSLSVQLATLLAVLLPVGALLGLAFQWAARLYAEHGRLVAEAYAVESLGGLVGGACATLLLLAGVSNLALGLGCGLVASLTPLAGRRSQGRLARSCAVVLAVGLTASLPSTPVLDRTLTRLNHPGLLATTDTPYGRVTLTALAEQVSVFINDALVTDSQDGTARELVHLAAIQRPTVGRVLMLGGGINGALAAVLEHQPIGVDLIELDDAVLALARQHLPQQFGDALEKAQVIIGDPRRYLEITSTKYDLILLGAREPSSGQNNRYFTRELFAAAAARLTPRGVLAFRLASSDNLLTHHETRRLASVRAALASELQYQVVLPGSDPLFFASPAPLLQDTEQLGHRWETHGIQAPLVSPAYIGYLYADDRLERLRATTGDVEINSDSRPVCYQYTLAIWLSRLVPELASVELDPPVAAWVILVLLLLMMPIVVRRRPDAGRTLVVGLAGAIAMVLETALVLAYQASRGALFGDLGLLLTAFMAGLTVGAWSISRPRQMSPRLGRVLLLGLVAHSGVVSLAVAHGVNLPVACLLLVLCGGLVASVFAHATRTHGRSAVVAPLYAADLLGGCLGSLVATLVLAPLLGLVGAALSAAGLGAVGVLCAPMVQGATPAASILPRGT